MADQLKTYGNQPPPVEIRELPPVIRVTGDAHESSDVRRFVAKRARRSRQPLTRSTTRRSRPAASWSSSPRTTSRSGTA